MVDDTTGDHETRVKGTASDTAERVPGAVVKPVPEAVEAIGDEVFGGSEVKPGIELVNNALEAWRGVRCQYGSFM